MHDRNTMASTPDTLFRKKSASKLLHSGIFSDIEIKVGTTTFKVHKAILCTRCEYFRRAFDATHGFKEALTNIITLEEPDTPEVVRAMLEHIHRGDYTATEDTEKQFLVDIGVLIIDKAFYFPTFSTAISMLYNNTPEFDRGLRDLIVNVAVKKMDEENLLSNNDFNEAMANSCLIDHHLGG
ncbi:hypothetical protein IWX47DRAFT_928890 [Phyllosticta citricarpa]